MYRSMSTGEPLLDSNIGLIVCIAKQYAGCGVDTDDLISEAVLATLLALRNYDPERGKFKAFAGRYIRNALRECVQNHGRTVRVPRYRFRKREPLVSSVRLFDMVEKPDWYDDWRHVQERWGELSDREQAILNMRYGLDGPPLTNRVVGEHYGVSRQRIDQIVQEALRKLREGI